MTLASQQAPDPLLQQQQAAAQAANISSIRDRVTSSTDQLIRAYGMRQALAGGARPPILGF